MSTVQQVAAATASRRWPAAVLALAALSFLLPFGTASCDGETVSFTGIELAASKVDADPDAASASEPDPEDRLDHQVESEAGPVALLALVLVIGGIGSALWRGRGGGFALAAGLTLAVLLLEGLFSLAEVRIQIGFWLALVLVATTGAFRLVDRRDRRGMRRRPFWHRLIPTRGTVVAIGAAVGSWGALWAVTAGA